MGNLSEFCSKCLQLARDLTLMKCIAKERNIEQDSGRMLSRRELMSQVMLEVGRWVKVCLYSRKRFCFICQTNRSREGMVKAKTPKWKLVPGERYSDWLILFAHEFSL
jgi:hypothetical protein